MFEFYHDMAGSNVGVGSLAFISNTNDMWLKTREGWKKIGVAQVIPLPLPLQRNIILKLFIIFVKLPKIDSL